MRVRSHRWAGSFVERGCLTPPPDPALYATVVRHVAEHYKDGWDNGYHLHIRCWEIWNEPDLVPFWSGTSSQFYALFADTARAVKSLHPWMEVGGPALTTNNDLTGYRESLLTDVRDHHVPLDFYSDPMDFVRLAQEFRQLLDTYGFTRTAIQLTEWNYGLVDNPTDIQRATFVADSLIYVQHAPLQRAFYYRADGANSFALIDSDGTFTKPGDAYQGRGGRSLVLRNSDSQDTLTGHGLRALSVRSTLGRCRSRRLSRSSQVACSTRTLAPGQAATIQVITQAISPGTWDDRATVPTTSTGPTPPSEPPAPTTPAPLARDRTPKDNVDAAHVEVISPAPPAVTG